MDECIGLQKIKTSVCDVLRICWDSSF